MRTKRIIALSAMALGLAAAGVAAPAAAAPPQGPGTVEPANSARCSTGLLKVEPGVTNLPVRRWPSPSAPIWETYDGGQNILCVQHFYTLGERYDACDGNGANGYIIVDRLVAPVGYVYMTCVNDA